MNRSTMLAVGGLLGGAAVALGALGAHGFRNVLDERQLEVNELAVRYQIYHALALVLCACLPTAADRRVRLSAWLFLCGTVTFSGSLYLLNFGGPRWLGPVTPIGGVLLIAGWVALATVGLGGRVVGDRTQ